MPDILVLGATGFTGRLVTRYLASHPARSSFTFAIAARSKSKLDELKRNLQLDDAIRVLQVDVTQPTQVEDAVKSARVVINTVGPFWKWGDPVVRACALNGRHYVDLAGETHWIRRMIWKYDYVATKNNAIIIPCCGFDSVPADLLVLLANNVLKDTVGPQAELGRSLTVYKMKGGLSGGTFSTIMTVTEIPPDEIRLSMEDYSLAPGIRGAPTPGPKLFHRVPLTSPRRYAMPWFMGGTNRAVAQRTWGLHALAARAGNAQDDAARRVYGPRFTYDEGLQPGGISSFLPVLLMSVVYYLSLAAFFFLPPVRWVVKHLAPASGEGPSEEDMKNGWFEATNYTASAPRAGEPEVHVKTVMRGSGDPGYELTSVMIGESALAILLDKASLPALANQGGILTPASALGEVLVRRLEATGRVQFESTVVRPGDTEESRKAR
ncbi:hypothetical protein POSPLADRAFT_1047071 [Postia placenta MAD-698-R-SB12]|uniref:Saccharopine dehydrogenase NADP binding domain-containing protein n=1 Tax=Postia placenta MAD-698-R-SB12 TaxID=670580 RepID=A0A1X6N010_9APHY|nr:hypothetical protein POSPLADRAFT_1047071 [Postia placenta MAD-698-R-SB12]OSX61816.1 hypothetical protein POSPLADRAFT_1047071 [Postia placenta MAD-698-R-SB12]